MRKFPTITKGEMHVSIVRVPIAFCSYYIVVLEYLDCRHVG